MEGVNKRRAGMLFVDLYTALCFLYMLRSFTCSVEAGESDMDMQYLFILTLSPSLIRKDE